MCGAVIFLLITCLLQGAQCQTFSVSLPQNVEVMKGSCVTVPCSFQVATKYEESLKHKCRAHWHPELTETNPKTGDLTNKNCTTTFNNVQLKHTKTYKFRLECPDQIKYTFKDANVKIKVTNAPPSPTVTPSSLEVEEGASVSLKCSAPAPCLPHPPTLTWTPRLGDSQETLQINPDQTHVKTSVLNFTASLLHHGQKTCSAVYKKQDGSPDVTVTANVTVKILYSPKNTKVSISPSGPVTENSPVSLTCSSHANPAVKSYTWYRSEGDQGFWIGIGRVLNITASVGNRVFFCEAENKLGVGRSDNSEIDCQFPPWFLSSSDCSETEGQVRCSCETVGNPRPTLHWHLDGQPVNHSDLIVIKESLNVTNLRSIITVNQSERDFSSLLCISFSSMGSASKLVYVNLLQRHKENTLMMSVFITTLSVLLLLVFVLLFVIRLLKTRSKSLTTENNTADFDQHALRDVAEKPNTAEESFYSNSEALSQKGRTKPAAELSCSNSDRTEGDRESSRNKCEEDVVYTTVDVTKKK